jgi:anaerobic ribonucleoside-triphosphate reductase
VLIVILDKTCRAFLSPWFDENGNEIYIGRFNVGAITMILPKYAIESKGSKKKFFEHIDKYMEMIAKVHDFTYRRMANKKASSNPLFFCEGGCAITLKPEDTIEKALECATASFGIIGLEEAIFLLTGKHIHEDNSLAIEIMEYIQHNIDIYKEKYNRLFAFYMTPSEGLADKALKKDLKKYGEIKGVTDKEWYTNSFHVDVRANISGLDKMDIEKPMFDIAKGGRIIYTEIPDMDNEEALEDIINQAMKRGLYYGVNFEKGHCYDCGAVGEFKDGICSHCGSKNVLMIDRVCGYLGVKKLKGVTRYNNGKDAETDQRVKHYNIVIANGLDGGNICDTQQ